MARNGLLIDYDYCTGCHTCEVACQQEHNYSPGKCGIKVTEYILEAFNKVSIYYLPFPTDLCNLCVQRTQRGEKPACVKHCQADVMRFGPIGELVKEMEKRPKMVLYTPS
jgi:Fe-S-cluster-containing dehydrogenase component